MEQYKPNWKKQQQFLRLTLVIAGLFIAAIVVMRWNAPSPTQQALMTPPKAPAMVPPPPPPAPAPMTEEAMPTNSAEVAAAPIENSAAADASSEDSESASFQPSSEANADNQNQ